VTGCSGAPAALFGGRGSVPHGVLKWTDISIVKWYYHC
jgi:hypothetical protein